MENMDITLTKEQQFFIDRAKLGKNILVDACIGSGKTTTIQKACDELLDKNILYLTYNRRLYDDAVKKIHNKNVMIATFHRFAGIICMQNGYSTSSVQDVCQKVATTPMHMPKYDVVIVDEYQDLRADTAGVLDAICKMTYIDYNGFIPQFLIVGDMHQKIYDTSSFKANEYIQYLFGIIKNDEYMRFTQCFRLSESYAASIGQAWGKSIVGCNPHNRVEYLNSIIHLANILNRYEPNEILVLGGKMSWGARTQLQNLLEEKFPKKFNKDTVYASLDDQDEMQTFDTSEAAIFTTYDSAKGLERRVCVICDYNLKYLEAREKYSVSRQVLKNIFLVAASRGKERIIFYTGPRDELLDFKTVGRITGDIPIDMKPVNISQAFDHKYEEDVRECRQYLKIEKVQEKGAIIKTTKSEGFIDLSACIGIHAAASFFKSYDIDMMIARGFDDAINRGLKLPAYNESWSLQKKILYLTAMETGQLRYIKDIKKKYISKTADEKIQKRLSTVFSDTETVEQPCRITFMNVRETDTNEQLGDKMLIGRCDVITKDDILYELKFVDTITPSHELQAALYAIAFDMEYAILWNLQDNEQYKVSIAQEDIGDFLQAVCKCISKDMLQVAKGQIQVTGR